MHWRHAVPFSYSALYQIGRLRISPDCNLRPRGGTDSITFPAIMPATDVTCLAT